MRYVNVLLGIAMVAFAAVQYNDPDPHVWVPIYGVAAAWAFAAAFWLPRFSAAWTRVLLALSVLAYAGLVFYYWPEAPQFWRKDVWWVDEAAREGMGAMIALAVLLFVSAAAAATARNPRS